MKTIPGINQLVLSPAMQASGPPEWPGARWVGAIDVTEVFLAADIELRHSVGYGHARLLVRDMAAVRGFVDVAVSHSHIDVDELRRAVARLPPRRPAAGPLPHTPTFTVVICTRDRPAMLREVMGTVMSVNYAPFDVVVVDNSPSTTASRDMVRREFPADRVTIVEEPAPGLSRARNTGLAHARGDIVAFTDDDVAVDVWWLRELARAFAQDPAIACVTGLVPSGELRARVQGFFDDRTSWSKNLEPRIFSRDRPPADLPLFPFCVGEYGTGANFAVRREVAIAIGGFDTALGAGTRPGGGEDLDFFTRVVLSGRPLALQPSAVVWHRHRGDLPALRAQAVTYGTGLGAWLTKVATTPSLLRPALVNVPRAAVRLAAFPWRAPEQSVVQDSTDSGLDRVIARVGWLELSSVIRGPWRYGVQRWKNTRTQRSRRAGITRKLVEPAKHRPPRYVPR